MPEPLAIRERARQALSRYLEEPAARLLLRLKVTPNAATLVGLFLAVGAAYLASQGAFLLAGLVLLLASVMDMLDGALARLGGQATKFGAALDSAVDRLAEAALLLGLAAFFFDRSNKAGVLLAFLALVASFMVSYLRARGEGLGVAMKESGLVTRTERVLVMVAGLLTGWVFAALVVVLALSTLTFGQRLLHLWRGTAKGST